MPYTIMPFGTFFRTGDLNFHITGMHWHFRFSLHSAELHFPRTVFRHIMCSPMCIILSIFRIGINHLQREKNPGSDLMQEIRIYTMYFFLFTQIYNKPPSVPSQPIQLSTKVDPPNSPSTNAVFPISAYLPVGGIR